MVRAGKICEVPGWSAMLPGLGSRAQEWREVGALGFAWQQQEVGQGCGAPPVTRGVRHCPEHRDGGHLLGPAASRVGGIGWRHRNGCYQGQGRELMQP